MNQHRELLVLKYSSELVACQSVDSDGYDIDHNTIRRHAQDITTLLERNQNLGLVIVTSVARKLITNRDAWVEISNLWVQYLGHDVWSGQVSEETFEHTVRDIINHVSNNTVCIINGDDNTLTPDSRLRNNDHVAAELVALARCSNQFSHIELGMFTTVDGLLRDIHDSSSLVRIVTRDDVSSATTWISDGDCKRTTGGMTTKLAAAAHALEHDAKVWIANGYTQFALHQARCGKIGATFVQ